MPLKVSPTQRRSIFSSTRVCRQEKTLKRSRKGRKILDWHIQTLTYQSQPTTQIPFSIQGTSGFTALLFRCGEGTMSKDPMSFSPSPCLLCAVLLDISNISTSLNLARRAGRADDGRPAFPSKRRKTTRYKPTLANCFSLLR